MYAQQRGTETQKSAYFRRIAESKRKQLEDADIRLINSELEARYFTNDGRPVPRELVNRIDYYRRQCRTLKQEMHRALFHVEK